MKTVFVTLTVCLLALPAQVKYSGGTGEPNDPYQIATAGPAPQANYAYHVQAFSNRQLWGDMRASWLVNGNRHDVIHGEYEVAAGFAYELNLGTRIHLETIHLYPRQDCCPERLTNFRLSVHDDADGQIGPAVWSADLFKDGSNAGSGPGIVVRVAGSSDPAGTFVGQWIRLLSLEDPVQPYALQIAEIEVFGTPESDSPVVLIDDHPRNTTAPLGRSASFDVTASIRRGDVSLLRHQWQKNRVDISGATSATYTTPPVTPGDAGAAFRCRLSYPGIPDAFSDEAKLSGDCNYARGAYATANGPLWSTDWTPARLVDGDRYTAIHGAYSLQPGFAYEINLGSLVRISRINVVARQDCCQERLTNYRVTLHLDDHGQIGQALWQADLHADDSTPSNQEGWIMDVLTSGLDPDGQFEGQWVRIQSLENPVQSYALQIGEVEVVGQLASYPTPSLYPTVFLQAGVEQVGSDVLQFWMDLASPPALDPDPERWTTIEWYLDTDSNPTTGDPHGMTGSEYIVKAILQNHPDNGGGFVFSIQNSQSVPVPMVVDGTRVIVRVTSSQIGSATGFTWNCGIRSSIGFLQHVDTPRTVALSSFVPPAGSIARAVIGPILPLCEGVTNNCVPIYLSDALGEPLPLSDRSVRLWAYPDKIEQQGNAITAKQGCAGWAKVSAMVDGVVAANTARAWVGAVEVVPALMHLNPHTRPTGQVSLLLKDAYNTPLSIEEHNIRFWSWDPAIASVSHDGLVQAKTYGSDTNTVICCTVDRVTWAAPATVQPRPDSPPLLPEQEARGTYMSFWYPPVQSDPPIPGSDFDRMLRDYDFTRTLEYAYHQLSNLTGGTLIGGRQNAAAIYLRHGGGGGSCGWWISAAFDPACSTCNAIQNRDGTPNAGLFFHEMTHEFFAFNVSGPQVVWNNNSLSSYGLGEGIANFCGMYVVKTILDGKADLDPVVRQYFSDPKNPNSFPRLFDLWAARALTDYVKRGHRYPEDFNPSVASGMYLVLADRYGWGSFRRFFSILFPPDELIDFQPQDEVEKASFIIAAFSAATKVDVRSDFQEWGFPCNDALYIQLLPMLEQRAKQRDIEPDSP